MKIKIVGVNYEYSRDLGLGAIYSAKTKKGSFKFAVIPRFYSGSQQGCYIGPYFWVQTESPEVLKLLGLEEDDNNRWIKPENLPPIVQEIFHLLRNQGGFLAGDTIEL